MSARDDGGPAFPQMRVWNAERAEYEDTQQYPGMSMRDWFAGQALLGMICPTALITDYEAFGREAYRFADAMLAARKGPQQ